MPERRLQLSLDDGESSEDGEVDGAIGSALRLLAAGALPQIGDDSQEESRLREAVESLHHTWRGEELGSERAMTITVSSFKSQLSRDAGWQKGSTDNGEPDVDVGVRTPVQPEDTGTGNRTIRAWMGRGVPPVPELTNLQLPKFEWVRGGLGYNPHGDGTSGEQARAALCSV